LPCDPNYKGYCRDFELEKRLSDNFEKARIEANKPLLDDDGNQVGHILPITTPEPSWWVVESCDPQRCVPYAITSDGRFRPEPRITPNEALKYLTRSLNYLQAKVKGWNYSCTDYPRDPAPCQHATQYGGIISRVTKMITTIKQAQVERIEQQWQTEKAIQVKLDEDYEIKVEKEEKAWIAKRNKTLLLIGSLFLFG